MSISISLHTSGAQPELKVSTHDYGLSREGANMFALELAVGNDTIFLHTNQLFTLEKISFEINAFVQTVRGDRADQAIDPSNGTQNAG